jgi:hypothetical protein
MLKLPSVHLSYKLLPVAIAASRIVSLVLNFLLPPSQGYGEVKKNPPRWRRVSILILVYVRFHLRALQE